MRLVKHEFSFLSHTDYSNYLLFPHMSGSDFLCCLVPHSHRNQVEEWQDCSSLNSSLSLHEGRNDISFLPNTTPFQGQWRVAFTKTLASSLNTHGCTPPAPMDFCISSFCASIFCYWGSVFCNPDRSHAPDSWRSAKMRGWRGYWTPQHAPCSLSPNPLCQPEVGWHFQ